MLIFCLILLYVAPTGAQCPPLGSTLPLAPNVGTRPAVQKAVEEINQTLHELTSSFDSTAIALTIGTARDAVPFLEFYNKPNVFNLSGSHILDTDTQFAVASVSKLFTAYGIMLLSPKIHLQEPVTKFVPELLKLKEKTQPLNAITTTDWEAITIESLMSHTSGIAEDLGDEDIDNVPGNYSALGLPALTKDEQGTHCGDAFNPYQRPCTEHDFFTNWGRKSPVYAPSSSAVYSNAAYAILGLVIARVSGVSFAQYMQDAVIQPLGLNHTSVDHPLSVSGAFITNQTADGDIAEGFFASSGAIYSSSRDLHILGSSILSSTLLSPAATRAWLKPRAFTSSSGTFVGNVWEIARSEHLTGGDGHIVDVYTKSGNLDLYSSLVALVPDYNLVFSLTSAGPDTSEGAVQVMFSQIMKALVPALEAANKAHAKEVYAGTYTADNNSVVLIVDDGPGLLVTEFRANGVDSVIDGVGELLGASKPGQTTMRLYPTNLSAGTETAWVAVYDTLTAAEAAKGDAQLFFSEGICQTWSGISILSYGLRPIDQFVFTADDEGRNVAVNARAWRSVMSRV